MQPWCTDPLFSGPLDAPTVGGLVVVGLTKLGSRSLRSLDLGFGLCLSPGLGLSLGHGFWRRRQLSAIFPSLC